MSFQLPKLKAQLCILLWCSLCLLSAQVGPILTSELNDVYLPDCSNLKNDKSSNIFIATTMDGHVSVIDAVDGSLKWSKSITSGPLLSSSINNFLVNARGEILRIVPSLDGSLYVYNGHTIKQTKFSTDTLLKKSVKFEGALLAGGHISKIIALNRHDGSIAYECDINGCSQMENNTFDDVVLFQKRTQSVRAINSLSGKEEWHFVVNDPQLQSVANQHCHNGASNDPSKYSIDLQVHVSSGYMYSSVFKSPTKQLHKQWQLKLDSPIVNVWHYEDGKLEQVNLFTRIKSSYADQDGKDGHADGEQNQWKLLNNDNAIDEAFFMGSYNNQLYIQNSPLHKHTDLMTHEDFELSDLSEQNTAVIQVALKEVPALEAETSSTDTVANKFEVSSIPTFPVLTFNELNFTGYYIFKLKSPDKCERISLNKSQPTVIEPSTDSIVYASLSYYWKEITIISILSGIVMNFFTSVFKKYLWPKRAATQEENKAKDSTENEEEEPNSATIGNSRRTTSESNSFECNQISPFVSRYKTDFEEIALLGRGGFGIVFEAKHRIDESHYAIKRITIPAKKEKRDRFIREIRVLSKLNHPGIVRYLFSWIEEPPVGWQESQDKMDNLDITEYSYEQSESTNKTDVKLSRYSETCDFNGPNCQSNNSLEIIFEDSRTAGDGSTFRKNEGDNGFGLTEELPSFSGNVSDASNSSASTADESSVQNDQPRALLKTQQVTFVYIQMELCRKETLKDWLLENKEREKSYILDIFNQIIDAVNFIHSQKLIHRDLKPSNIFFGMDLTNHPHVKIGDFGLVTNAIDEHCEISSPVRKKRRRFQKHTNDVGTQLYMSPEQVKKEPYDHKVDIFSSGIILYELLQSFNTESERVVTLQRVRNKQFPSEFTQNHTEETQVLHKLLSPKPNERPEAGDILLLLKEILSQLKQAT